MNNFFRRVKTAIVPTDKDLAMQKGQRLVADLVSGYSIEEQTEVILSLPKMLAEQRKKQIVDTEQELVRLKADYAKLLSNQSGIIALLGED